jgi:hypothetical protein
MQNSTQIRTSQGSWARSNAEKAQAFAHHLAFEFKPHPSDPNSIPEATLTSLLETPFQLEPTVTRLKRSEMQSVITNLPTNKSPGYDHITRTLKELPTLGFQYPTQLFNAMFLHGYFPAQWEVAQIILIPKPGKPAHAPSSYQPISLLPIASKVFEKLLLNRLLLLISSVSDRSTPQLNKLIVSSAELTTPSIKDNTDLQPSLTSLKHLTRFGIWACCTK